MSFQAIDFLTKLHTEPSGGDAAAAPESGMPATSAADPRPPVTIQAMPGPGGCLTLVAPTPEIAEAIKAARPALEKLLVDLAGDPEAPAVSPHGPDGWPAGSVEPGEPCPKCGSLEKWWDLQGGEHCARCEARKLARGLELADRAARLRQNRPRPKLGPWFGPCEHPAAVPDVSQHVAGKEPSGSALRPLSGMRNG